MSNAEIVRGILRREGGFVDHPADRGGPTNRGITLATYRRHRGPGMSVEDLKHMTEAEAAAIYEKEYIEEPGFNVIYDDLLRSLVVDCAVNHGAERAVMLMQKALGVPSDGVFGTYTRAALATAVPRELTVKVLRERARFYARICVNHPDQLAFLEGWMNRVFEFVEELA